MRTIGIYSGNFQPPHKGHYAAYTRLKQVAGPDTFVVTTDLDPTIEAALHFGDKEQILVRHGIPDSHIKKVRNLKNPIEILDNFDPETTVIIYALNKKSAHEKISSSDYFKPLDISNGQLRPFKHNSYIITVDEDIRAKNKEGNLKIYTSKNIREALGSHRFTKEDKVWWFKQFFGWFDLGLFELLKNKYTNAHQSDVFEKPTKFEEPTDNIKESLSKEIVKILNELMSDPPSIATDSPPGAPDLEVKSDAEKRAEDQKNKLNLVDKKRQAERDLDSLEKDLKWKQSDVIRKRKDEVPNKRKEIDTINQQITQTNQIG